MLLHHQRAAMFGLDARIALAIFGGLSIITGAALFSAISQTETTRQLTELENVNKALTQFMVDTGSNPTQIQSLLVDSGIPGWNGPYLMVETASAVVYISSKGYATRYSPFSDSPWSATLTDSATACATPDSTCHFFAVFGLATFGGGLVPIELHENLDELVDDGDGFATGNYRVREQAGPRYIGYLKGPQRLR